MNTTETLLTRQDVAELAKIAVNTVDVYRARGILAEPDGYLGNKPYWHESTVRQFLDNRYPPGWHGQRRNRSQAN